MESMADAQPIQFAIPRAHLDTEIASVTCMTDPNLLARFGLQAYKVFLSSRGLECSACFCPPPGIAGCPLSVA